MFLIDLNWTTDELDKTYDEQTLINLISNGVYIALSFRPNVELTRSTSISFTKRFVEYNGAAVLDERS